MHSGSSTLRHVLCVLALPLLIQGGLAYAQAPDPDLNPDQPPAPRVAPPPPVAPPPVAAQPAGPTKVVVIQDDTPDHDKVTGRVGIRFFGLRRICMNPFNGVVGHPQYDFSSCGSDPTTGNEVPGGQGIPVVGIKWWFTGGVGLNLGLGVGMFSPGHTPSLDPNPDTQTAFMLEGGLPLVITKHKHLITFVEPGIGFGVASQGDYLGYTFFLSGKVGAELSFGFIGIPQLSLEASIGLKLAYRNGSVVDADGNVTSSSEFAVSTTVDSHGVQNMLWSAVAATYYF
jgi:hypothetical protein